MFQKVSTIALLTLLAVRNVMNAATPVSNAAGSKPKGAQNELTVDLGKDVKLEMVLIPAGEFMMGSSAADKDAADNEKPQHRVRITKPFYLGKQGMGSGRRLTFTMWRRPCQSRASVKRRPDPICDLRDGCEPLEGPLLRVPWVTGI